jgi:hypothetical protein
MDKDLVKTVVFDLTLEIARLKDELENARSLERMWFTNYTKKENELNARNSATVYATEIEGEFIENMAKEDEK